MAVTGKSTKNDGRKPNRFRPFNKRGSMPQPPMPFFPPPPWQIRQPKSSDDRHVMAKHANLYPTALPAFQKMVMACEKTLKLVSDQLSSLNLSPPCTDGDSHKDEEDEQSTTSMESSEGDTKVNKSTNNTKLQNQEGQQDDVFRSLKGVQRVGVFGHGLLLQGDRCVDLVALSAVKPTETLLRKIYDCFPAQLACVTEEKYELELNIEQAAMVVIRVKEPKISCKITLTSPMMRENQEISTAPGNQEGQQEKDDNCNKTSEEGGEPDGAREGGKPDGAKEGGKPDGAKEGGKPDGAKEGGKPDGAKEGGKPDGAKEGGKPDGAEGGKPDGAEGGKPDGAEDGGEPDEVKEETDTQSAEDDGKVKNEIKTLDTNSEAHMDESDPPDVLNKRICLDALAELRRAKWFQARARGLPNCVVALRILRDLSQRVPLWASLNLWAMELLVEKCLGSVRLVLGPGNALRRVFECLAAGIILPTGQGLYDPCEREPTDPLADLAAQDREDITAAAQHMLRLMAFRRIRKVLDMEPLPTPRRKFKQRKRKIVGEEADADAVEKRDKREGGDEEEEELEEEADDCDIETTSDA